MPDAPTTATPPPAPAAPKPKALPKPPPWAKYNFPAPKEARPLDIECLCFRHNWRPEQGGLGRFGHLKNMLRAIWPGRTWHEWSERRMHGMCTYDFVAWTGCATSGKTDDAALYAMTWWIADPAHSTVIMTSTTGKMLRKRIWPVVQRLFYDTRMTNGQIGYPATLIDSEMLLRVTMPDGSRNERSCIFAKAVREGSISKAAADIQGLHNRRVLVIIDEGPETPPAIFHALSNLMAGCEHFQVLVIGNPESRYDEHGKFSEPLNGWGSITPDAEEWETVIQLNGKPGLCQRFDGELCPNVLSPCPEWSFLLSREQLEGARRKLGENSPEWWKYMRGLWAPEGVCNTVLSEPLIERYKGRESFIFGTRKTPIAGLDPGFGGDNCVLRFGEMGDLDDGRTAVRLTERVIIKGDVSDGDPIDHQIAKRVIAECRSRNVEPKNFGMDATGTGRGVYAILFKEWSPRIVRVEFGGAPSMLPAAPDDPRPAKEIYDRRVTELWFSVRALFSAGLLRGLDFEEVREFCTRTYEVRGGVYHIQTKEDMKSKFGRSPDEADAVSVLVEVARQRGVFAWSPSQNNLPASDTDISEEARRYNALYAGENFQQV